MSSSASRVWTISGRPVSRAAAIWAAEAVALPVAVANGRNNNRARSRRSRSPADARARSTRVAVSTSGWASASCGWMPTDAKTSLSRSAMPITSSHSEARVEMLSMAVTPAARARAEHALLVLDQALIVQVAMAIDEHAAPLELRDPWAGRFADHRGSKNCAERRRATGRGMRAEARQAVVRQALARIAARPPAARRGQRARP